MEPSVGGTDKKVQQACNNDQHYVSPSLALAFEGAWPTKQKLLNYK